MARPWYCGNTPMASMASCPRFLCQLYSVSQVVAVTCIQPAGHQPAFERDHAWFQGPGCFRDPGGHRPFRELTAPQISHQFSDPRQRKQLKLRQIDRQGSHPWPILGKGLHAYGEGPCRQMPTGWPCNRLTPVFGDHQAQDGQLVDLPALFELPGDLGQLAVAYVAGAWSMGDDLVWSRDLRHRMALVTALGPSRFPTLFARGRLTGKAIAGRRFATVVAIFGQPPFQFFNPQQGTH